MATKYLDSNGLLYLWGKIKSAFVGNVSYNSTTKNLVLTKNGTDSNIVTLITQEDIPEGSLPSSTTPKMDGTATIGSETAFARGDHRHPSDTSRVPTSRTVNGKALSANITIGQSDIAGQIEQSQITGVTLADDIDYLAGLIGNKADKDTKVNGHALTNDVYVAAADIAGINSDTLEDDIIDLYDDKVDKVTGKGLSTNDYTNTDKAKVDKLVFDGNNLIDSSILPSFVDDVIEAYARSNQTELGSTWLAKGSASGTVITPETGKIYVLMNDSTSYATNTQFRWGGTAYVKLNDGGVTAITNAEIDVIVAS